jgi:Leucine Rich repeats (2 copies)
MSRSQPNQPPSFTSFADWCLHKDKLSEEAKKTVKELLGIAKTSDCYQASEILSNCTELKYFQEYWIRDISPLSSLVNLTSLDLQYSLIRDISPLSSLVNLTSLNLWHNSITDISPLSSLVNLTSLDLHYNGRITDISPLSSLVNLTSLDLKQNGITDISPLSSLVNLKKLDLSLSEITDISPLSSLVNLTYLNLNYNQITDISPLSSLVNLTYLNLDNNQITDISPLSSLVNLKELDLTDNQITDLSPLRSLNKLNDIWIYDVGLPKKYFYPQEQWQPQWLLSEKNAEIRRLLIQTIGYDRICQELEAIELDAWREYTLLGIDINVDEEPIYLLKMTCPSTGHIHVLRVPPDVNSAREAIRWVNWGIDPEEFAVQT